jgi:hypothetical protein
MLVYVMFRMYLKISLKNWKDQGLLYLITCHMWTFSITCQLLLRVLLQRYHEKVIEGLLFRFLTGYVITQVGFPCKIKVYAVITVL